MAAINSLRDGYANETGVFSAATSSTTSVQINHTVMLPSGVNTQFKSCGFGTSSGALGTNIGALYVSDGAVGTLTIANAACPIRFGKVGGVIQIASSPSLPQGQL